MQANPSSDPLLQPYGLRHLVLRNRFMSTAHEPAYTVDGMPKERYRLYHREKAKGGIALTMIGGSAIVAPDSPPAFGNIMLYRDEVVGWLRELADDVHAHGARSRRPGCAPHGRRAGSPPRAPRRRNRDAAPSVRPCRG